MWLQDMESVHPGFAKAHWDEYQQATAHERDYENERLRAGIRHRRRGQIDAWLFAAFALLVAAYLIDKGHGLAGAVIGVSQSLSTAATAVASRSSSEDGG